MKNQHKRNRYQNIAKVFCYHPVFANQRGICFILDEFFFCKFKHSSKKKMSQGIVANLIMLYKLNITYYKFLVFTIKGLGPTVFYDKLKKYI
ncbi:MAG: hypothetical protein ABI472_07375 [Ginsengibacter sp.]